MCALFSLNVIIFWSRIFQEYLLNDYYNLFFQSLLNDYLAMMIGDNIKRDKIELIKFH